MKKSVIVFGLSILFVSCGGSTVTSEGEEQREVDTTTVDTVAVDTMALEEHPDKISIDVEALISKAEIEYSLPLEIDSAFIEELGTQGEDDPGNLTNAEAQYLSFDYVDNEPTSMGKYNVETFIRLDSMKIKGEYEDYLASLDIGMARYSNASALGTLDLNNGSFILIWSTDYATYEACPYGQGTCVFGTLFTDNVGLNTLLLGESSGGGDAPYWGDKMVTSSISEHTISIHQVEESGGDEDPETGEEIIEHSEEDFLINIFPEGFAIHGE